MTRRIEWLKDRISQLGHPPQMYEKWHAEIGLIESGLSCTAVKREKRRAAAFREAGIPGDVLPEGMVYAHGMVMSEKEARIIGDQMAALGDLKPASEKPAYFRLARKYLITLRGLDPVGPKGAPADA